MCAQCYVGTTALIKGTKKEPSTPGQISKHLYTWFLCAGDVEQSRLHWKCADAHQEHEAHAPKALAMKKLK